MSIPQFGRYIAQLREERRLSQRDLAKIIGFSQNTLSKIENGQTASPSLDVVLALSRALEIPMSALILAYEGKNPNIEALKSGQTEADLETLMLQALEIVKERRKNNDEATF
ncbi:MAG: helix-turn-helix domain-containing protein [Cyanobacteria bacterium]|nr:helix-turn-helix domain-containing protein [Cyanobacteriota bacterium]